MKKQLLLCVISVVVGCINYKSKKDLKYTVNLCKLKPETCNCDLYVEGYIISRAFGSTDIYSEYLTDSNSFRIYIGNYDEGNERLKYTCKGDTVYLEKRTNKDLGQNWDTFRIIEKKIYVLKDLKKRGEFE
jgi:hypothetical protein